MLKRAQPRAANAAPDERGRDRRAPPPPARKSRATEGREKGRSTRRSTSEPFQNVLSVDLVGFVIAGERVHDQIDAAAQRKFALPRPPRNQRIERAPVGVLRPRRREIVRGDDDRRNAVAGARRALRRGRSDRAAGAPRSRSARSRCGRRCGRADRRSWSARGRGEPAQAPARRPPPEARAARAPRPSAARPDARSARRACRKSSCRRSS